MKGRIADFTDYIMILCTQLITCNNLPQTKVHFKQLVVIEENLHIFISHLFYSFHCQGNNEYAFADVSLLGQILRGCIMLDCEGHTVSEKVL